MGPADDGLRQPRYGDVDDLSEAVAAAGSAEPIPDWGARLVVLARMLGRSARVAGMRGIAGGRWIAGVLVDAAPRLPVRTRAVLIAAHPGLSDDQIAVELVTATARTTSAIGAAAGALSAVEFMAPPTLLAAPVQVGAETLAVAAAEVRLLAELYELYGLPLPDNASQRAFAYLTGWANQRVGVESPLGTPAALRQAAIRQLRIRLLRRLGGNVTTLAPFLAGAVAGAEVNRRATRELGGRVVADLRALRAGGRG